MRWEWDTGEHGATHAALLPLEAVQAGGLAPQLTSGGCTSGSTHHTSPDVKTVRTLVSGRGLDIGINVCVGGMGRETRLEEGAVTISVLGFVDVHV